LILNPIRKVLSTLFMQDVRALLMGGQACVLYGAAEFSQRRTTLVLDGDQIEVLSLPDLVRAKRHSATRTGP
jgi:hypothetical protein